MNDPGKPKIGLLPLTLEMYNEYSPEVIEKQRPFVARVAEDLGSFSEVRTAPVCAKRNEIGRALADLEAKGIDLLVVLFVTYAASISALKPLLDTNLPLLLYSTTPKSSMAEGMSMEDIMLNHGVHGYMDLANVLRRNSRPFFFVCGKMGDAGALREIQAYARAAGVKRALKQSIIGLAGYTFDGMGDFGVDTTLLNAELGPETRHVPLNVLSRCIGSVTEKEVAAEIERDASLYEMDPGVSADIHRESNRVYLGLRKFVKDHSLNAFTMHFQGILESPEIRTLPFLAISKLQKEGLAYAGEGDLLGATANLMVRFLCGSALFTETFCPDFDGGRIVMGHMGESNPDFGVSTVLRRKKFVFGKALDPVVADVSMKEQTATVLNLGIVEEGRFQMVVYSGTILKKIEGSPDIDMPYFHFKPDMPLPDFLTEYSLAGGTHHVVVTAGNRAEDISKLAETLDIQLIMLT